jgi:hypothetical protein
MSSRDSSSPRNWSAPSRWSNCAVSWTSSPRPGSRTASNPSPAPRAPTSRAARSGGRLRLVSHDPAFRRLLRLTALTGEFELFDDLTSAIAQQPKDAIA